MLTKIAREALHEQIGRDAHLVLTRSVKPRRPCLCFNGGTWRRPPYPTIDDVVWHMSHCPDAEVGIRPSSVHATVLDVDRGRHDELVSTTTPDLVVPSRRVNGVHLWFADDVPRENHSWEFLGAGGEVRSGNGYVIQTWHKDNPVRIAEALDHLRTRSHAIVGDLFDHYRIVVDVQIPVDAELTRRRYRRNEPLELRRIRTYLSKLRPPIGGLPGNRNIGLFDLVRRQSYRIKHDGTRRQAYDALLTLARSYNSMIVTPMDDAEIKSMVRSAIRYHRTYDPEDQRRRGRMGGIASGEARRAETVEIRLKARWLKSLGFTNDEIGLAIRRSGRQVRRMTGRRGSRARSVRRRGS